MLNVFFKQGKYLIHSENVVRTELREQCNHYRSMCLYALTLSDIRFSWTG
jgi:hypothetical protein